jgi:hypothetical protein
MAPPAGKETVVQHKLETVAEWEAHTEANAPKDWLYGARLAVTRSGPTRHRPRPRR